MNFIVIDLEWNQPLSYDSLAYKQVHGKLLFEMIQIGAVKVNEAYQVEDSTSILIRPQHYTRIHPRIRRMTGLNERILAEAPVLDEAFADFIEWCGEDAVLLTWGGDDISVLYQNLEFYKVAEKVPPMYDLQHLFSDRYQLKERAGLQKAMEMLQIGEEEGRTFHNAMHDAYYTALVFGKMENPDEVLRYPQKPRSLRRAKQEQQLTSYPTVMDALMSEPCSKPACPVCKKTMTVEPWVRQTADKYLTLAECPSHSMQLLRALLNANEGEGCTMKLQVSKAAPSHVAYVHTKRLQMDARMEEWKLSGDVQADPDLALRRQDRSNMPTDD